MAAIQVKHAENKQLQNKTPATAKGGEKKKLRSHRKLGEKMLQSSANQAFVELFSTSTAQSLKMTRVASWFSNQSKCSCYTYRSAVTAIVALILTTVDPLEIQFIRTVYVRGRGREKQCVSVCLWATKHLSHQEAVDNFDNRLIFSVVFRENTKYSLFPVRI